MFRIRAFQQNGQETAIADPLLAQMQEDLDPEPGFHQTLGGPATHTRSEVAANAGSLIREARGLPASSSFNDFLTEGGLESLIPGHPASAPDPFIQAQNDLLLPAFEDRSQREELASGIDSLLAEIAARSKALNYTRNGRPQALDNFFSAALDGDLEGALALHEGTIRRYDQLDTLKGQAGELNSTLLALDRDGISPNQALRDFIARAPTIDGLTIPDINPENETPEDVIDIFKRAHYAYALGREAPEGRVSTGFSGAIGRSLDGYNTLLRDGKIILNESGHVVPEFDRFSELEDYVDFFTTDMQIFDDLTAYDQLAEDAQVAHVEDWLAAKAPHLYETYRDPEFRALAETIADRLRQPLNRGSASDAVSEWLVVERAYGLYGDG